MTILHICTNAMGGGAAKSIIGLHNELIRFGHDSKILADAPAVGINNFEQFAGNPEIRKTRYTISDLFLDNNRSQISNSYFSLDFMGCDLSSHPAVAGADVIHLHWTADFLSSRSIVDLGNLSKKIVWTLHDTRPLTGGCHFPSGCVLYQSGCKNCPQLLHDEWNLTAQSFEALRLASSFSKPFLVAPSNWMAKTASKSGISYNLPCRVIPYGVDTTIFRSGSRENARAALNLPQHSTLILLACHSFQEKRKGGEQALSILDKLSSFQGIYEKVLDGRIRIVCCGYDNEKFIPDKYITERLGFLNQEMMVHAYQAADLLLFTSLEDNLPNVVLEAMACGLPVAAHSVGGVPDLIGEDDPVGLLLDPDNANDSACRIAKIICDSDRLHSLSVKALCRVKNKFNLAQQAQSYLELYKELAISSESKKAYVGEGVIIPAILALNINLIENVNLLMHKKVYFDNNKINYSEKQFSRFMKYFNETSFKYIEELEFACEERRVALEAVNAELVRVRTEFEHFKKKPRFSWFWKSI